MPAGSFAAGQRCGEGEVCACLCSFACGVQESKMLTVNTTEEGPGNDDGHVVAVAVDVYTWS